MDGELKIGGYKQIIDEGKKYRVYSTDSLEVIKNGKLLGGANSFQEACALIKEKLTNEHDPYWRYLMGETATFIDYGSWSRFAAIVPPVSIQEIEGES